MQKLKNTIKRLAAISAGTLMLGATVFGAAAAAYTLADYPAPFVTNGEWVGLVVIGADASGADSVGAVDIMATIAQGTSGGGTTSSVAGGISKNIELGTIAFGTGPNQIDGVLKDDDIAGLQDTTISFDDGDGDEDYDVEDMFNFSVSSTAGIKADVAGLSGGDPDYSELPALEIPKNSIKYYFEFDEAINLSATYPSNDNTIEMTFLGKEITITNGGTSSITAQVGDSYYLSVGESTTVMGKTVKLLDVNSDGHVMVDISGVQASVSATKTVNGVQVHIKDYWSADTKSERAATLIIGETAIKTYSNDEAFLGEDKSDPDWRWDIGVWNAGHKHKTNVTNAKLGITFDQSWNSDDEPVLRPGDSFAFADSGFKLAAGDLSTTDYAEYTFELDTDLDVPTGYNTTGFVFTGPNDDSFATVAGSAHDTKAIYLLTGGGTNLTSLHYWDVDNNNISAELAAYNLSVANDVNIATLNNQDATLPIWLSSIVKINTKAELKILEDYEQNTDKNMTINLTFAPASSGWDYIGDTDATNDLADIEYDATQLGTRDEDVMTPYGIVIKDPSTNGDEDKVELRIPSDQVFWNIQVTGPGTAITSSTSAGSLAGVPVVKLDTEVTDNTAYHSIVVGGAAVNRLAAALGGVTYPTYGAGNTDAFGISDGKGTLKLYDMAFGGTKTALLVAGWSASDTRNGASVLKDYSSYSSSLTGSHVIVTAGPTVTEYVAPTVTETTTETTETT